MKLLKNIIIFCLFAASAAFSACGDTSGGTQATDIESGLSSDYFIKSLTFSSGTLKYPFNSNDWLNYLEVPYSTETITVTADYAHRWQSICIDDELLHDGKPSQEIALAVGTSIMEIKVTAEDGQVLIYTIYVTRCSENYSTARLSELTLSGQTLSPGFSPENSERNFLAIVTSSEVSLHARAFAESEGAAIEAFINNIKIYDFSSIQLPETCNTLKIISTAPDGRTKDIYIISVIRQENSPTAGLAFLSVSGGSFDRDFNSSITDYNIDITSTMNPVNITAIPVSSLASVTVRINNGEPVEDISSIPLSPGIVSVITITVSVLDTSRTYTINATSLQGSDNANLKEITIMGGAKSYRPIYPGTFADHDPDVSGFNISGSVYTTVIYGFSSITVTAVSDDSSVKAIQFEADGEAVQSTLNNGTGIGIIPLQQGKITEIRISVLAGDGSTKKIYSIQARLLNADEFYWGVYASSFDASKNRWKKPGSASESYTTNGIIHGKATWSTGPVSNLYSRISISNYNDGKQGFMYNDGGFIVNGTQYTKLDSAINKNGINVTENPPFEIKTKEGETIATLNYHLQVRKGDPKELPDSYTEITYMGTTRKQDYRETNKPAPFSVSNWYENEYTAPSLWD